MGKTPEEPLPEAVLEAVEQYALEAHADLQQFDAQFMEQFADTKDWQSQIALLEASAIRRFDICAEQLLFASVTPNRVAINPLYEQYLYRVLNEKFLPFISQILAPLRADIRDDSVSRIDLKLRSRVLHWLAESKRRLLSRRRIGKQVDAKRNQISEPSRVNRQKRTAPVPEAHGTVKMSRQAKLSKDEEQELARRLKNPAAFPTLSVKQAANVLHKSEPTIYRYISEGKLQSAAVAGRILTRSVLQLTKAPKSKR